MNPKPRAEAEKHFIQRAQWLRAAVLGANDGIISISSLILGFVASHAEPRTVLLSGFAGLGAGALSMAAGEYVSVSSQSDIEKADLRREKSELARDFESEKKELAGLYIARGLTAPLARQVAEQLMAVDPLAAHARDELGISDMGKAKPLQAAAASAFCFTAGGIVPVLIVWLFPTARLTALLIGASVTLLASLGFLSAKVGGSPPWRAALRVSVWGCLAMALTSAIGGIA